MATNKNTSVNIQNSVMAKSWCVTDVNLITFDFLWIIKDFSLRTKDRYDTLVSSVFSAGPENAANNWRLILHPKGSLMPEFDDMLLQLELVQDRRNGIKAMIAFSVLNANGDELKSFKTEIPHDFGAYSVFNCKYLLKRSELYDNDENLLHGDTLSILCKINLLHQDFNINGESKISNLMATESLLSEDFNRLFESGDLSDVTLMVLGEEFQAHKVILAARSKVFAAMFAHDMTETNMNRVIITDIEPIVLQDMLRYIYTNKGPTSHDRASDLLIAADKYGLVQLMRLCEYILAHDITIDNATEMLRLADGHNAKHLKAHAIEFINLNATRVMETEGWKNLVSSNSHLIVEAYGALITLMEKAKIQN